MMKVFLDKIAAVFLLHKNDEIAFKQKAYLRNQFEFLGLTKPQRSTLEIPVFKEHKPKDERELQSVLENLWSKTEREYHYCALEYAIRYKKLLTADSLPLIEKMIREKAWWDTVDTIATHLLGHILKKNPSCILIMHKWSEDSFLWIRRSALLYQLKWKKDTDADLLFHFCFKLIGEKDFFIRKAIGWALREYSKTNPEKVREFIQNQPKLSPLSIKEGSKYL